MLKTKITYPDFILNLCNDGKSIFYIISKEPGFYKFGITTSLRDRMKKHYYDFQFTRIDVIIDCKYDSVMRSVETEFKRAAATNGILITKYDKTEIIRVNDITPYIAWVHLRIAEMLQHPQPENKRLESKKRENNKLTADILLLQKLRDNDRAEILLLRDKVFVLEDLVKSLSE